MSQQEYTIHIFGQDITSQDGLFRLDEIRRVGIQIGKVADNRSTEVARFMRTKAGKHMINPKSGLIRLIRMGELGSAWLATPVAAVEFGRWLDFEYGLAVSEAFVSMTSVEIAELTGKEHRNVLRDIRNMAEELNALKTEQCSKLSSHIGVTKDVYLNAQGKQQPLYRLDRKHTFILIAVSGGL